MSQLLVIAHETGELAKLVSALTRDGFDCKVVPLDSGLTKEITARRPDLVLVELDDYSSGAGTKELYRYSGKEGMPPVIALIPGDKLAGIKSDIGVDDFITSPYNTRELSLRIRCLLSRTAVKRNSSKVIERDGLLIDRDRCEVTVNGGLVELTFREYELLCFLASNPGHVYTREALLDRVWGYDYYGGDRTVDVHIRRLRGKIEDVPNAFIETVRNIGYRFKKK